MPLADAGSRSQNVRFDQERANEQRHAKRRPAHEGFLVVAADRVAASRFLVEADVL